MLILSKVKEYKNKIILISLIFIILRTISLGFDQTNNDSIRWYIRSESFLQGIKDRNFSETYQKYHPGVTLMLVNSIIRQSYYTYQYSFINYKFDLFAWNIFPFVNLFSKFALIIVIFLVILFQTFLIKNIWEEKVSIYYFLLLAVEPYFIGINRWFHLTSFEVVFGFTSILCLLYWHKTQKIKFLYISSIFLALAVLTKVTSIILGPIILFILIVNYLKNRDFKAFFYFFIIYISTIFLLFPALWVEPVQVSARIIDSIFHAVGEDPRVNLLSPFLNKFYYLVILPFKLSPITLILFGVAAFNIRKFKSFNVMVIFLVLLVYLISMSFSDQKIDRYSLVFFQPIILISATYLTMTSIRFQNFILSLAFIMVIFVGINFGSQFSAYYNPLLGGTKFALDYGVYENGGSFFYEAANLLNQFDPQKRVYVPDNVEAFSMFYNGKTVRDVSEPKDYIVVSLDIDRKNFNNLGCKNFVQSFGPRDYKVVAIYSCK